MGQDRYKNRYWLFAGGKGRGWYAGKVLVEDPSKTTWGYYSRDQVAALVDLLNPKGKLEVELRQALLDSASLLRSVAPTASTTSTPITTTSTTTTTTTNSTTDERDDYISPALQRLKDTILSFKERIPEEYIRQSKELKACLRKWEDEDEDEDENDGSPPSSPDPSSTQKEVMSVASLATLLLTVERHITKEALVDDWSSTKKTPWEEAVHKCLTTAQLGVCLAQLEESVKDIATPKGCIVCGDMGSESRLLLCDTCEAEYHTYCLNPPLRSVPAGDWFCPACQEKKPNENDDVCAECKQRGELLCCDYCSRAYHLKCCVPPLRSIPRGKWTCVHCAKSLTPNKADLQHYYFEEPRRMTTRSSSNKSK